MNFILKFYFKFHNLIHRSKTFFNKVNTLTRLSFLAFLRMRTHMQIIFGASVFITVVLIFVTILSAQSEHPIEISDDSKSLPITEEDDETRFKIVQATPRGEISNEDLKKEIVIVFNRPIMPLAKIDDHTEGIFTILPQVEGKFRWYGSRVCAFVPTYGYNPGTVYRVRVPKGIKSLDGAILEEGVTFEFSTPKLKILEFSLVGKDFYDTPNRIEYNQAFQIIFNYPVSTADVEKNVQLRYGNRLHPFKIIRPSKASLARWYYTPTEKDVDRVVIVQPERSFGRDKRVVVFVSRKLVPQGGNSPMEEDYVKEFHTFGPLEVSLEAEGVTYFQDMWLARLNFNNPVYVRDVVQHISIVPNARWRGFEETKVVELPLTMWELKPDTKYSISISKNLKDAYGNPLRGENSFQFETPSYRPSLHTLSDHVCIEALMSQKIPVDVANVPVVNVSVVSFSFDELAESIINNKFTIFPHAKEIANIQWKTNVGKNSAGKLGFDFSQYLDASKRGWLGLKFSTKVPKYNNTEMVESYTVYVQSTDLGITVKQGIDNLTAWIHSLTNGHPLKGVRVSAYEGKKRIAECITDAEGCCSMMTETISKDDDVIFVAESDNGTKDKAFVTAQHHAVSMHPLAHYSANKHEIAVNGLIVFDRKLYRPGDDVGFKAVLGLWKAGKYIPTNSLGGKARVQVRDSSGKTIFEKSLDITQEGGVFDTISIPKDAPLGHYSIYVQPEGLNPRSYQYLSDTFQVEEFRPVGFSVQTTGVVDSRVNTKLKGEVEGKYLFGAPMQKVPVQLTFRRKPVMVFVERFGDYLFGDEIMESKRGGTYEYYANVEGKTNLAGIFPYELMLTPMADTENEGIAISAPFELEVEARVMDVDNKSVTKVSSCTIFGGDFIFGIKTDSPYRHYKEGFDFDLIALGNDGNAKGTANATIFVHREEVKSIQSKGPGDSRQMQNVSTVTLVHREDIGLSEIPKRFSFKPKQAGTYIITVKEKTGLAASRTIVYAWGGDFGGWWLPNDDVIKLVADKNEYKPGETARILVQSPFPKAQAIVTVERENILWKKSMIIGNEGKPLEIAIKKEYIPNVYVSVMIITPRAKELSNIDKKRLLTEDLGIPRFKIGIIKLNVNTSSKQARLEVVTDKQQYVPRDSVEVEIVSEPNAEVALSVADRGVLDLVDYHYPQPLNAFYRSWPLSVRAIENRRFLVHQLVYALKGNAPGGGDGEGDAGFGGFHFDSDDGSRKNFKYTAYWNPAIKTDAQGKARIRFTLPDNFTTFRILALASAKGKYAKKEHEFVVRTPVVVQPIMPRVIRPGDELEIGAVVVNQTSRDAEFEVAIASPLLHFKQTREHYAQKVVNIAKGSSKEITFVASVNMASYAQQRHVLPKDIMPQIKGIIGCTTKTKAKGSAYKDQVEFAIPIRENPPQEAFAIAGFTDSKIAEGIIIPSRDEVFEEMNALNISLSSTALVGLQNAFDFYYSNPYFCIEQRASAFLCAITSGELLQRFQFKPPQGEGYNFNRIKELFLDSLTNFQNSDGGFSFWADSHYKISNPYLTAYVTFVLQYARDRGYKVNEDIYDKAQYYLLSYVRRPQREPEPLLFENYALIYRVFAKDKKNVADLERVLSQNSHKLSLRAKANFIIGLADARGVNWIKRDKNASRIIDDIKNNMEFTTRTISFKEKINTSLGSSLYSPSSTLGVILQMMLIVDSSNPLIPQIVRFAIENKAGKMWNESHGVGNLAVALYEYAKKSERGSSEIDVTVNIAGHRIMDQTISMRSNTLVTKIISISDLLNIAEPKIVHNFEFNIARGKGRLYYAATLQYSPKVLKVEQRDEGIEVRKEIFRITTNAKGEMVIEKGAPFICGQMYVNRIIIINPKPYFNFIVNDPLPSNFEAVQSNFATESTALNRFIKEKRKDDGGWWFERDRERYELRDDRVIITQGYLSPGVHEYYYLMRPVVKGKSIAPSTHAFLMYAPEVFGRTASATVEVK